MAGNYRFEMDQKDINRFLNTTVGSFIQDRLIDKKQRKLHKEQCAERLAAEDGCSDKDTEVQYSEQAVLANLDWGMDALEEAINTSNMETKLARLDYAEKMLQVCAMLNSHQKTAGVPNFYLSAWAHLNLSYLWKLRNNISNSVLHVLEMFIIDPFFSRIDFAPELWKSLFLPHMSSIIGWYSEARHRLMMEIIPDSSDLSFTVDFDQFFNESLVYSVRPDQAEKMQKLEQLYGESLDDNTRLYAKYYKDCINYDSTTCKKVIPMVPIAEPPMTPLHEVSRKIPDYVKFGPILPKSAGFSAILKDKEDPKEACRLNQTSVPLGKVDSPAKESQVSEDASDYEQDDSFADSHKLVSPMSMRIKEDLGCWPKLQQSKESSRDHSPTVFSPLDSPKTPSPKVSSSKQNLQMKREPASILRLLSRHIMTDSSISASLPASPPLPNDTSSWSTDLDSEVIVEARRSCMKKVNRRQNMNFANGNSQLFENSYVNEMDEGSQSNMSFPLSEKSTQRTRPPKDFVCPITSQIFSDPVTLETGQTYERKAIQEWIKRGNTTCPITRQPLSAVALPKTNYVLKRLITSWKEQHPDIAQEFSYSETPRNSSSISPSYGIPEISPPSKSYDEYVNNLNSRRFNRATVSTSPTSVISQATLETVINDLKPHIECLCNSEDLKECETAVLTIAKTWKDSNAESAIHCCLSTPTIVNGFVEILSASLNREVIRTSIYILSELISAEGSVGETLTSVDSDFDCLASLLKNGLSEAAVLIYQLRPSFAQLLAHEFISSLVQIISNKHENKSDLQLIMEPKEAAIALLEEILMGGDENCKYINAMGVISANGIPALIKCMDRVEGRHSIVSVLLCCIKADRSCRNVIATRIDLPLVLELFHGGNDGLRGICVEFLSEIVQLNRRTICNKVLQRIKEEGAFSTMHAFLVYLQMAPMEQQLLIATLLLQLDLLVEPRKMSIYREEAIEALIEGLRRKDFLNFQIMASDALISLSGRLTSSGKSYNEELLLKIAGFDQPYNTVMKEEKLILHETESKETMEEDEKAAKSWEKRVAFVLCNHEKGSIFKVLEECLKSDSLEMAKSCLVLSTWLVHMLSRLPETGVRNAARKSLLDQFINVLLSSRNLEEKILATLALKSFIKDQGALEELGVYAKGIYKVLRKLKRNSVVVTDILKALMNLPSVNAMELWSCSEVVELGSCTNGEVLCLLHLNGRVLSSHADGTIKVWDAGKRVLRFIQEVREHTKAVTCLYVSSSGDKLYSGSLDKTIRVWTVKQEEIYCVQVHDVKEPVYHLIADPNVACFSSQGSGIKVYNWSGVPKHINFNKYVKCLAMSDNTLYCGCSGYSIQEVDLCKHTSSSFYSGAKKLLGKQTIYSLHIQGGLLFAGGSSVDGTAGKVFSISTKGVTGSLSTGFDIQCIAVSNDFLFTGTKCGTIEVWLKERVTRIAAIKMGGGGHTRITSLVLDANGDMLFAGSSDGKIQAWALE